MTKDEDYRNTMYCLVLENVEEKKQNLESQIKLEFPKTKIVYNRVHDRKNPYHKKFAEIYNDKCAYCGAVLGLLPLESFEVDHFLNEASFPKTTEGRVEAGRMKNLIWSCVSCNRGKRGITIKPPYDDLLNVDNGKIADVFRRDKNYYIRIYDAYREDEFIQKFYEALHLGYETRRLDYLLLQLKGRYQNETNEENKCKLGESLSLLLQKRNRMTVTGRKLE